MSVCVCALNNNMGCTLDIETYLLYVLSVRISVKSGSYPMRYSLSCSHKSQSHINTRRRVGVVTSISGIIRHVICFSGIRVLMSPMVCCRRWLPAWLIGIWLELFGLYVGIYCCVVNVRCRFEKHHYVIRCSTANTCLRVCLWKTHTQTTNGGIIYTQDVRVSCVDTNPDRTRRCWSVLDVYNTYPGRHKRRDEHYRPGESSQNDTTKHDTCLCAHMSAEICVLNFVWRMMCIGRFCAVRKTDRQNCLTYYSGHVLQVILWLNDEVYISHRVLSQSC